MLKCRRLPEMLFPHLASLFSKSLHSPLKNLSSCFVFKQESQTQFLEGLGRYKMNKMGLL